MKTMKKMGASRRTRGWTRPDEAASAQIAERIEARVEACQSMLKTATATPSSPY
jgi:hypothetical protein